MHVSHETIYLSLFVQSRGVLKKALMAHLRQRRTYRRPKHAAPHPGGRIVDAVSIRERPATIEDRAIPGHWEGDLLVGGAHSQIATLVERSSRYVLLIRLRGKETRHVVQALTRRVRRLPAGLMRALTSDRGYELAAHRTFSIATGAGTLRSAESVAAWVERKHERACSAIFPRGTDLSRYRQTQPDAIAHRSTRVRERHSGIGRRRIH
jgi:IS30 family transposase